MTTTRPTTVPKIKTVSDLELVMSNLYKNPNNIYFFYFEYKTKQGTYRGEIKLKYRSLSKDYIISTLIITLKDKSIDLSKTQKIKILQGFKNQQDIISFLTSIFK